MSAIDNLSVEGQLKLAKELLIVKDEYIVLLLEECLEVIPLAYSHGWRSTRHEAGKLVRERIKALECLLGIPHSQIETV